MCLSFEFAVLANTENIYGFKSFEVFGLNLGIIALIPIVLLLMTKRINIKKKSKQLSKFVRVFVFMNFTGIFFGLVQLLLNDNNIQNLNNYLWLFAVEIYNMSIFPLLLIGTMIYIIIFENQKLLLLEGFLISILIGVVVSLVISLLSGIMGHYGGLNTLLVSNVVRYIPFMLLFPLYKYSSKSLFFIGIIGSVLTLIYNANGKFILIFAMLPVAIFVILWRDKKYMPLFAMILFLPLGVTIFINVINIFSSKSILFNSKLRQVVALLEFWNPNWLTVMPLSPRIRIIEFIDIVYEYLKKPWFFIFGKGYMGTIIDHSGMLGTKFIPGSFSINEWLNGTFYSVHETLNSLFLYNGLFGVAFYFYMIKYIYVNFTKSVWVLIGGFWILMIYGYSVTMTAFGLTALLLGFIQVEEWERIKNEACWDCNI